VTFVAASAFGKVMANISHRVHEMVTKTGGLAVWIAAPGQPLTCLPRPRPPPARARPGHKRQHARGAALALVLEARQKLPRVARAAHALDAYNGTARIIVEASVAWDGVREARSLLEAGTGRRRDPG
jgi:hypothetical protein